jgi:hypothetical protein
MVTIMIGAHVTLFYEAREIEFDTSYFHNPHSPGDELVPLHHIAKGDGVDEVEGPTRSGSGSGSPPILAVFRLVLCSLCFFAAPSRNRLRGPLYSRF